MTEKDINYEEFEDKIGHHFKNRDLLTEAFTHSSYANENKLGRRYNERLEFLGDSVLSLVVSRHLFTKYPELPEGELTKVRAALVCEKALDVFASKINLGKYLLLGKGEEATGGRQRSSILADAFEAVIAAVYLDGGFETANEYVLKFIPETLEDCKNISFHDYKTRLQEVIQKNPEDIIEYELVEESGPDHNKLFVVEVTLDTNVIGKGRGRSKKEAEQMAAKEALSLMGYHA